MHNECEKLWWTNIGGYIMLPKVLFRDPRYKGISVSAKLLYGFLLDRTSLSATKGDQWKTADGNYYVVFSIKEIMDRLCCGHDKASKLLDELVSVALISRTRKNRNRAYRIVVHPVIGSADKQSTQLFENRSRELYKSASNNTEENNLNINTDTITPSTRWCRQKEIQDQVSYDVLLDRIPKAYLDSIIEVIVDATCSQKPKLRVHGELLPAENIRNQLVQLTEMDINYVYDCMQREHHAISYLPGYILSRLLDSESIKDIAYDRWCTLDQKRKPE